MIRPCLVTASISRWTFSGGFFELAICAQSTDHSHMSVTLSNAEAKHLLQMCKAGRLLDVQDWINSGKSLCVPSDFRTTPLKVALDTGFHSLVELLVRNEASQEIKNRALRKAVAQKRLDSLNCWC